MGENEKPRGSSPHRLLWRSGMRYGDLSSISILFLLMGSRKSPMRGGTGDQSRTGTGFRPET